MPVKPVQAGQQGSPVILAALKPKQSLPDKVYDKIAAVHNSSKSHWGQRLTRKRLNDQFIRQCPCCQVMSRIHLQIKTHPRWSNQALYYGIQSPLVGNLTRRPFSMYKTKDYWSISRLDKWQINSDIDMQYCYDR
jgi:hypothetical protein